ncbi:hypothetical protein Ancab_002632 [Ancistrocladus abbreviatus]
MPVFFPFVSVLHRSFQQSDCLFCILLSKLDMILSMSKKRVEDIMPIATGHEKEELEAELKFKLHFSGDFNADRDLSLMANDRSYKCD